MAKADPPLKRTIKKSELRQMAPLADSTIWEMERRGRKTLVADTSIREGPTSKALVEIACEAPDAARRLGHTPRVAFLSSSSFGHAKGEAPLRVRRAAELLEDKAVDFEFEGEMPPDIALDDALSSNYPFQRLSEPA